MKKHTWLMMAGCGVMLVGVFVLPALGIRLGGALPILLALACPLSMIFMMGSMRGGHNHSGQGGSDSQENRGAAPCHEEKAPRELPAPPD